MGGWVGGWVYVGVVFVCTGVNTMLPTLFERAFESESEVNFVKFENFFRAKRRAMP